MRFTRTLPGLGVAILLFSCRGYDTIPVQEAQWRRVEPELVGMSADELRRCAGPPLREGVGPSGASTMIYRAADLKNYCEVTLELEGGRVHAFSADYAAPELLWLVDGTNYCGRIFAGCIRRDPSPR